MAKNQLNVRIDPSRKSLLTRLSTRSGLGMAGVIEYALTLVDERDLVSYANKRREDEAQSYAA